MTMLLTALEALNDIAAWHEGDVVRACFDEPASALRARDALYNIFGNKDNLYNALQLLRAADIPTVQEALYKEIKAAQNGGSEQRSCETQG